MKIFSKHHNRSVISRSEFKHLTKLVVKEEDDILQAEVEEFFRSEEYYDYHDDYHTDATDMISWIEACEAR